MNPNEVDPRTKNYVGFCELQYDWQAMGNPDAKQSNLTDVILALHANTSHLDRQTDRASEKQTDGQTDGARDKERERAEQLRLSEKNSN